jgi:hypothetical protein
MSRFESLTPWSRTWGQGVNFVAVQSFEWCFNRLSLAESRQFGCNVNPPIATLARVSFHLGPMSLGEHNDLSASFVFLHATMRLDDLVEVESLASLDVQCAR